MKLHIILSIITAISCTGLQNFIQNLNDVTTKFNSLAADISWESSVNPGNTELPSRSANYQRQRIAWEERSCARLAALEHRQLLNGTERRITYLMCRGPKFTLDEARLVPLSPKSSSDVGIHEELRKLLKIQEKHSDFSIFGITPSICIQKVAFGEMELVQKTIDGHPKTGGGKIWQSTELKKISVLYEDLQSIYSDAKICIPSEKNIPSTDLAGIEAAILEYISTVKRVLNLKTGGVSRAAKLAINENPVESVCLYGDVDFDKMMRFSRNEDVLRWLWLTWRGKVGPPMKEPFKELVTVENGAAKRNGYTDIGAAWREELEVTDLRLICRRLYYHIKPLYSLLHGVARFYLRKVYGDAVPKRGAIPAHLLGNLWAQNWEAIADLILPQTINLDKSLKNTNWTTLNMVRHAEDFYQSLGLPAMTDKFWRESVFERQSQTTRCHGTAADMFKNGDYRLLYCSGASPDDFYVIHHEMGHIQYYMAYENQPGVFRQANSALHETIGDTIMFGVQTPQHLNRLGLINDSLLYVNPPKESSENYNKKETLTPKDQYPNFNEKPTNDDWILDSNWNVITTDDVLLLKQALNKIPQIPFSLVIDEYRWRYFEGDLKEDALNEEFWDLVLELQGLAPPEKRDEDGFDAGAKYHVPDNTPFIRYFLSSFLQHQLFESLCKAAVFGRVGPKEEIPKTIPMNRCDIYGSKAAGKLLKDFMSRGHSQQYQEILQATIGTDVISASALGRYYRPLYKLLVKLVRAHRIPIGW